MLPFFFRSDEASIRVSTAIKRMRHGPDNLSLSSGGNLSWSSGHDEFSPREAAKAEDIDHSISSLGPFIDLLFEKVELMPNNNLATNLLVTSLISQLVRYSDPNLKLHLGSFARLILTKS